VKFRTAGTTEYVLTDVVETEVSGLHTGKLSRISDHPIGDIRGFGFENTADTHEVLFTELPTVGHRFEYVHPVWDGCSSSPVSEILEE